ncbi:hypothetical protein AK88_05470 [Plasmodium fragile]|uniref:Schizont-infected cell agglutination extracellular alpha domain-containing protein n=1 Tax=Plasmodium fragile TaxID=5857 RepID=A0A0D9QCW8_PLAFR|nr:uncharacterized protein AK88_05470 [Plasmodium fragile]KJP84900.1 hypothetical protein AK88_05470 [Plasmodium fragile]
MAAKLGELLVHYTKKREIRADEQQGDTGQGSFSEIFWGDVKTVYRELLNGMHEHRDEIDTLCSTSVLNEQMFTLRTEASSLCEDIMKVYYFMDGIPKAADTPAAATQSEDEINPLMRCMVGYVTLAKKFAPLCDFNTLVPYARKATDGMRTGYQVDTSNTACNGLNFDTLKIGYKLVGATITEWIQENSSDWEDIMEDYMNDTCEANSTIEAGTTSGKNTHDEKDSKGAHGPISPDDLKRLANSKDQLSKQDATKVLNQIQGQTDRDSIMTVLTGAIAAVESDRNKKVTQAASTRSPGTHTKSSSSGTSTTSSTSSSSSKSGTSESAPAKSATAPTEPAATSGSTAADKKPKKEEAPPVKVPEVPREVIPEEKIPVPTPPSDAQAPAVGPGGRSDTPPADASVGTQKGKDEETAGKCTRETTVFTHSNTAFGLNGARATITLSIASSSENADDCDTTPQDSGPGDPVVDGGNDDPPPLNPPKPKPNPNPNQSGASGSGPDGTGSGRAGGGASSGGGGAGGSRGGGGAALTPVPPSLSPGLTWEDIKPYTPAIIPAVVGIGIIAFFLWKVSYYGNHGMPHVPDVYTSEHPYRLPYMIVLTQIHSYTRVHSFYPTVLTLLFTPFFCLVLCVPRNKPTTNVSHSA